MKYPIVLSINPLAATADTNYLEMINVWAQAEEIIKEYSFEFDKYGKWTVSIDTKDIISLLQTAHELNENNPEPFNKRLDKRGNCFAKLRLSITSSSSTDEETTFFILSSVLQELFLASIFCARGAGNLNGAKSRRIYNNADIGYYGDEFEVAWRAAELWNWPKLHQITFSDSWKWLEETNFRNCSVAEKSIHKVLTILLDISRNVSTTNSEPLETILLARALEILLKTNDNNTASISNALRTRIKIILGTPDTHKKWLSDFYNLRSRVVHGDYPLVREYITPEDQLVNYAAKFWSPLDNARCVVLALLKRLIETKCFGFEFQEDVKYTQKI